MNIDNLGRKTIVLAPGVMFTIEPNVYMPNFNLTTAQPLKAWYRSDQLYDVRDRVEVDLAAANRHAAPFGVTGQS